MVTTRSQSQVTESSPLPVRSKTLTTPVHKLGKRPGSDCHVESRDRKRARSATDKDRARPACLDLQLTRETTEEASGALSTAPRSTVNQARLADDLVENPAQLQATSDDIEWHNAKPPLENVANAEDENLSFETKAILGAVVREATNEITPDSRQRTPDLASTLEIEAPLGRLYDAAMNPIEDEQLPAILLPKVTETPISHMPVVVDQEPANLHIREDSAIKWDEAIEGPGFNANQAMAEPSGSVGTSLMTKPGKHTWDQSGDIRLSDGMSLVQSPPRNRPALTVHTPPHIHRSLMRPTTSSRPTTSLSRYRHSILERHKRTPFWGKKKVKFVAIDGQ